MLLGISGVFFGLVPTAIAMAMTVAFRLFQGGAAARMGVSVIMVTGTIGIAWRLQRQRRLSDITMRELYVFGLVIHVAMLVMAFTLPWETAVQVLTNITVPVLVIYPLGTALMGMLIVTRLRRDRTAEDLRESQERLRLAVQTANIGFFDVDLLTKQEYYAPEWKQQLGYSDDEIVNDCREWKSRIHSDDVEEALKRENDYIEGLRPNYESVFRLRHKNGTYRWILSRGLLQRNAAGKAVRLLGCHIDITRQKEDEEAIAASERRFRGLNAELERRVQERTSQLEAANKELEAFAYSVSHDLRAPLRALEGFSAVLLASYPDRLDERGQHYLQRIQEASRRMGQLINDLLSLSRVTRTEFKRQKVDLSAMASDVAANLHAQDPERQVHFDICPNLIVDGDAHLLRIVLENLLNNAYKFTSRRDRASIAFGATEQNGKRVFFVRDNGVGFDMTYASKLFAPFQRLHSMEEFPGTGIGLATVQRIIMRHGGRIWPEAVLDHGATFFFTIGGGTLGGADV